MILTNDYKNWKMATLITDNLSVGIAPMPGPPKANATLPTATWEFRPAPIALEIEEDSPELDFISTYEPFTLSVNPVPNLPDEVILSTVVTLKYCIIEEPLPGATTTRSLNGKLDIKASPYWAPGLFLEPLIVTTPGVNQSPAIIRGYFTERNWYDREITVSFLNAIARFTSDGFFYVPLANLPKNLPFDIKKINIRLPSNVNVNTFYPLSVANASRTESEILDSYLSVIGQVVSYKGTDIKKLRFYYDILITSTKGVFSSTAYTVVQYNHKKAIERLKYLLGRRRPNAVLNIPEQQ